MNVGSVMLVKLGMDCPTVASLNIGSVSIELKLGMLFVFEPF